MPAEPDRDPGDEIPGPVPSRDDRLWRHPSELSSPLFTDPPTGAPATSDRSDRSGSRLSGLAGTAVASVLVVSGLLLLTRPAPDGRRHLTFGQGVTASVEPPTPETAPVPAAAAAAPIRPISSNASTTRSQHPGRLGVQVADADRDGDGALDGALVVTVDPSGAAAAVDLRPGDVVTAAGTAPVTRGGDLATALASTAPGQQLALTVHRGNGSEIVLITLGS